MAKQKQKTFLIHATINTMITAEIPADSLLDAVTKAASMTSDELYDAPGEQMDVEIKITGAFEN